MDQFEIYLFKSSLETRTVKFSC